MSGESIVADLRISPDFLFARLPVDSLFSELSPLALFLTAIFQTKERKEKKGERLRDRGTR
jgi:hypothetical protein